MCNKSFRCVLWFVFVTFFVSGSGQAFSQEGNLLAFSSLSTPIACVAIQNGSPLFLGRMSLNSALAPASATPSGRPLILNEHETLSGDTDSSNGELVSRLGGDLFLTDEVYGLHMSGRGSLTTGAGLGTEIRFKPLFVGALVGFSGDEGISGLYGTFTFSTIYAGAEVGQYRVEIGEMVGDNNLWTDMNIPHATFINAFAGISRRIGRTFFVEPIVKVIFPISAHYSTGTNRFDYVPVVTHYRVKDLFLSFGIKLGIGFN